MSLVLSVGRPVDSDTGALYPGAWEKSRGRVSLYQGTDRFDSSRFMFNKIASTTMIGIVSSQLLLVAACAAQDHAAYDDIAGSESGSFDESGSAGDTAGELTEGSMMESDAWLAADEEGRVDAVSQQCRIANECLTSDRYRGFSEGASYGRIVEACFSRGRVPAHVYSCLQYRGGLGCWDRWVGCPTPEYVGPNSDILRCLLYEGGLSCYSR